VRLPDLRFSEYFADQNHRHNVDEVDVLDAVIGRRIHVSAAVSQSGKTRRIILAKGESDYLTIVCEPARRGFWWVLSAWPSTRAEVRRAKRVGVGEER
jgi:hypothetical protein